MASIFDYNLTFDDGYMVEGNPSWGGGFGENAYWELILPDGRRAICDMTGNIIFYYS